MQNRLTKDTVRRSDIECITRFSMERNVLNSVEASSIKIGILRTSSIGDVVLASSCIALIQQTLPHAQILWLGKAPALSIIRDAFPNVETIEIDSKLKICDVVKKLESVHILVDLQTNLRSRIISHAFKNKYKRPFFSCPKNQLQRNRLILESRIYGRKRELPLRALQALKPQYAQMRDFLLSSLQALKILPNNFSIDAGSCYPFLAIDHYKDHDGLIKNMKNTRWIALSPGASYETKQAPLDVFVGAFNIFKNQNSDPTLGLLFLGDKNDSLICKELSTRLNWQGPILDYSGKLTLWENAVALNQCMFLISNDSALAHIAEAVETPALVLYGPTVEGFGFTPRKKESRAFSSRLGCRPCSKHGKATCRFGDKLCFLQISQENIAQHMQNLISNEMSKS